MRELHCRDIRCDTQIDRPLLGVAANLVERPFAHIPDNTHILGDRDKDRGRDIAMLGVIPAHQRLAALDLVGPGADERLVVHRNLAIGDRVAQILLDLAAMSRPILQIARIEPVLAAPAALGRIERQIGRGDQFLGIEPVVGRDRNADRGSDDRTRAIDRIGLRQHLDKPLAKLAERTAIIDIGHHNLEFVTAQMTDFARASDNSFKPRRYLLEQFVAGLMAQCVADLLEPVEVERQ